MIRSIWLGLSEVLHDRCPTCQMCRCRSGSCSRCHLAAWACGQMCSLVLARVVNHEV